ncbi:MAG: head-tail adaptor protein [Sphingomonadales bacterium]|nr:head-tail adaptor protein [Sphingomonadaceae bacterium]MBS3930438.1 head-tail adaptor protein [Sphingomonadales bacterium]
MSVAQDTVSILAVWGQTVTIMRKTPTFSDSGAPTPVWASVGTATADIQPIDGSEKRIELGERVLTTHEIYFPNGTDIRGGDRVQPAGWAAGDDEYEVRALIAETPSHVRVNATLVRGHGG